MVHFGGLLERVPSRGSVTAALVRLPVVTGAVRPRIPGDTAAAAVAATEEVTLAGMSVSLVALPGQGDPADALAAHRQALEALEEANLAEGADIIVDPVDLGSAGGVEAGEVSAGLGQLCGAAEDVGATVTMAALTPEHLSLGRAVHTELLGQYPDLGATISADLLRSEADCADLAAAGGRVRLVRHGAGRSSGLSVTGRHEIDKSFVRCMRLLFAGDARPILATHDQRLIEIANALAVRHDRDTSEYWFQFRFGVRPEVAAHLVAEGAHVSILVPYGPDWSAYLVRHVDLRPELIGRAARAARDR